MKQEKLRILAVEDNPADFRLLQEYLKDGALSGSQIEQAKTLKEALQASSAEKFDIILLDLSLPDSMGLGTLEKMYNSNSSVPIIVLTGYADEETGLRALQKNAQDYIVKGKVQPDLLVKSILYSIHRKQQEELLYQSRQDLNHAQSVAHIGSWRLDVHKNQLIWSDETYNIFGISRGSSLTYETFLDAVHPDDRSYVNRKWKDALEGKLYDIEHRIIVDGKIRWVHEKAELEFNQKGVLIGGFGTAQDITEQRRAQEKINHLATFPQFSPNPIIEIGVNGRVIFSNLAVIETLQRQNVPKKIKLFFPEDFLEILKVLKDGKKKEFVREVRIKDSIFFESLVVMPELKAVRIYALDITELKRAEMLLQKAHDELEVKVLSRTNELVAVNKQLNQEILRRKESQNQLTARNILLKLLNEVSSCKGYLDGVAKLMKGWVKCRHIGIRVLDEEGGIPYESLINFSDDFLRSEDYLSVKNDHCVCIRVIKGIPAPEDKLFMSKAGSFYCSDTFHFLKKLPKRTEHKFRGVCIKSGFRTLAVIPIRHKDKIIGAIHLADEEPDKLGGSLKEFIESLSGLIGEGINKFNLEDKIRKNHTFLEAFFQHSISPLVFMDKDFNFIRVNKAYADYCNRKISEFNGHNYLDFYPNKEIEAIFRRVVETKSPYQAFDKPVVFPGHPELGLRYWNSTLVPILDEAGEVFLLVFSIMDITEQKRDEEKLIIAQKELEQAKRLSDIGTLAATVAHELRNPLAAMGLAAANIKRKAKNPNLDSHIHNIEKKITESDQIINNLLFYSRLKPPHCETFNISNIINECVDMLKSQSKKKISMIMKTDPIKDVLINADPLQLREVFCNILNNAGDAVSESGGIIEIMGFKEPDFIEMHIKDNGEGIAKENLDKVFNPFFTTKAKGTGLGLSVCHQIVSFHNGSINIESEPDKGTTVTVRLPRNNK